jgi:colanic acid biosynthesis glycosyl transferase WcaI
MSTAVELVALDRGDAVAAARLHRAAFPGFFLSSLGEEFLQQFYRGFLDDPTAVTVVARDGSGELRGVAVGTTDPAAFFSRLWRRHWLGFAAASVRATLRRPRAAPRLVRALRYRGDTASDGASALLSSICVDPAWRGQGLGRFLLDGWIQQAGARGASVAFLTTDAVGNDAVQRFYTNQGWAVDERFETREGRPMLRYRRVLETF